MEILRREQYREYEEFVSHHPRGEFTQSIYWPEVKNNWRFEVVVSRDGEGKIVGSCGVLIQKMPFFGTCFMYAPRGPVCDLHDRKVLDVYGGAISNGANVQLYAGNGTNAQRWVI